MRRATGLRKASDCRYRAERQRGGAVGLCRQQVELVEVGGEIGYGTASWRT